MMWKIIQELLPWVLVVLLITQYVIPLITNKQTWWLFRTKKETKLEEEVSNLKTTAKDLNIRVDNVKDSVEKENKKIQDMKDDLNQINKQ